MKFAKWNRNFLEIIASARLLLERSEKTKYFKKKVLVANVSEILKKTEKRIFLTLTFFKHWKI